MRLSAQHTQALLDYLAPQQPLAVAVLGSYARGEATPHSDLDLNVLLEQPPHPNYRLELLAGQLTSLKFLQPSHLLYELQDPRSALWAVQALRDLFPLYDPQGLLAHIQQAAVSFSWATLEAAANAFVSRSLMLCSEEAHKIVAGLQQSDASKTHYALLGLGLGLGEAMLVHRRVLLSSENRYFETLYQNPYGAWERSHQLAMGWRAGAFRRRGIGGLQCYWHSFIEWQEILLPEHLAVIEHTLHTLQASGYLQVIP